MQDALHQLTYFSRNRLAGLEEALHDGIRDILSVARRNNATVGVTGALIFNSLCFAQILEGSREAVEHIFERIAQDDRHEDVTLLTFSPTEQRLFGNWSMAYVGLSAHDAERFGGFAGESGFDPRRMSADALGQAIYQLVYDRDGPA